MYGTNMLNTMGSHGFSGHRSTYFTSLRPKSYSICSIIEKQNNAGMPLNQSTHVIVPNLKLKLKSSTSKSNRPAFSLLPTPPPHTPAALPLLKLAQSWSFLSSKRLSSSAAAAMGDPRESSSYSVTPRIRYNTIGGVNGPLVILENVRIAYCMYGRNEAD